MSIRRGSDAEVFAKIIAPFEKRFGIKVQYTSMKPPDVVQLLLTQEATGNLDIDAVDMDPVTGQALLDSGYIADVDWNALGVDADLQMEADGIHLFRTNRNIGGIGYNTTMISEDEIPDTWAELNDPKWKGQLIVDPRGKYLSGLALEWGEDETVSWYTDFMKNVQPVVVEGATASLQKVISGEVAMSTSAHDNEILEQQAKGAPVAIKYLDLVPTQEGAAYVMKNAKHPNAARCFYAWWASDEGSKQVLDNEFKSNGLHMEGLSDANKLLATTTPEDVELQAAVADKLAELTVG